MPLKPVFVEARDLDDCFFQLLDQLHKHGRRYLIESGSYEGAYRLAFDHCAGFIHHPHARPLAPIMPDGVPPPTTEQAIEDYFVNYLMDSKLEKNEDYRYSTFLAGGDYEIPVVSGKETCHEDPIVVRNAIIVVPNQIQWVIDHFNSKGYGNEHCFVTVGYPESNLAYDQPYSNPNERKTSPCLRGLDFRVVDGHLTTHVVYRSWDLWSGFPTNMAGFTLLNEYVSEMIGVEPGPLAFSCKSLHAYDFELDVIKTRLGKE